MSEEDHRLKRPPSDFRAIEPERPRGSLLLKLFLLLLLAVGAYGGYYGYCRYKVNEKSHELSVEAQDLQQALMRLKNAQNINRDDLRQVVRNMARKVGVKVDEQSLQIVIEPMTSESMKRLPSVAQAGMNMAAKIPGEQHKRWVVGFKGRFWAKHGVASGYFELERYTWFLYVDPAAATN